nr:hypothetical protein [Tanacetum cinerariifolium]
MPSSMESSIFDLSWLRLDAIVIFLTPSLDRLPLVMLSPYSVSTILQEIWCSRPMRFEDLYSWDLDKATWGGRFVAIGTIPVCCRCTGEAMERGGILAGKLGTGVIGKSDVIVVPDSENTLMHAEESRSKMIEKQNDPQMIERKVITKPIDYAILNQLLTDFNTRFVPQTDSYAEQAFWSQYSVQTDEPT